PAQGSLSPASGAVRWSGGPLTGTGGASPCLPPACDSFTLKSTLPASQWHASGGGIMVRIDWSDANSELDLSVLDASGRTIAASADGGVLSQQVFLAAPEPGTYQVLVAASPATAMSYRGAAWALTQRDPSAPSVAQGPMRFGAPSLVDPQLLAGEPGLAVGPDGRMYVSAPWGIQSATSLVWRSDDGGRRFVRRDGRLVSSAGDPTGRSCAEAEGGADA